MNESLTVIERLSRQDANAIINDPDFWREFAGWGTYSSRIGDFGKLASYKWQTSPTLPLQDDNRLITYIDYKRNERLSSMKFGKFFVSIYKEISLYKRPDRFRFGADALSTLAEMATLKWRAFVDSNRDAYKLVVDKDFASIYNYSKCVGSFGSCMCGKGYHSFYNNAVDADAASLRDREGRIVARCVIYNNVMTEDGESFRLAERQYSSDDFLKVSLIQSLIKAGRIDGFKRYDAGCGDACSFVSNSGEDWSDKPFFIDCNLDDGDILSYQDSFKYYDQSDRRAYNNSFPYCEELDEACGYYGHPRNYDEWADEYTQEDLVWVWWNGREIETAESNRENEFSYVERLEGYYHNDETIWDDYEERVDLAEDCEEFYKLDADGNLTYGGWTYRENAYKINRLSQREGHDIYLLDDDVEYCSETGQLEPAIWVNDGDFVGVE